MTIARKIYRGVMVAAAVPLALPALAGANPLLSGYGAPGQGSQVLLGSTLTGPRAGNAAGHGAAGSGIEAAPGGASAALPQGAASTSRPQGAGAHRSSHGQESTSVTGGGSAGGGGPTQTGLQPARSVSTDTAGLSSGDLALILIGIGVIAATGFLMTRLTRGEEREGRSS